MLRYVVLAGSLTLLTFVLPGCGNPSVAGTGSLGVQTRGLNGGDDGGGSGQNSGDQNSGGSDQNGGGDGNGGGTSPTPTPTPSSSATPTPTPTASASPSPSPTPAPKTPKKGDLIFSLEAVQADPPAGTAPTHEVLFAVILSFGKDFLSPVVQLDAATIRQDLGTSDVWVYASICFDPGTHSCLANYIIQAKEELDDVNGKEVYVSGTASISFH